MSARVIDKSGGEGLMKTTAGVVNRVVEATANNLQQQQQQPGDWQQQQQQQQQQQTTTKWTKPTGRFSRYAGQGANCGRG
jgi:curli biogenesis system outer membrane secretion channel CsgG